MNMGHGAGQLVAGLLSTSVGWRYYFYANGSLFILMCLLLTVFVPDSPLEAKLARIFLNF